MRTPAQHGSHFSELEELELSVNELEQISELTLSEQLKELSLSQEEGSVQLEELLKSQEPEEEELEKSQELLDEVELGVGTGSQELDEEELQLDDSGWPAPSQTGKWASAQEAAAVIVPAFN